MAGTMRRLGENGYTIQELAAVGALLIVIIIPSLFLIHPKSYSEQERNAQRSVYIAELMQGIHKYVAQNGSLPNNIPTKMEPIGTASNQVNLCKDVAPTYMKVLPVDPFFGAPVNCSTTPQYETGFAIVKTGKGTQVTIAALGSEGKIVYLTD
jgi:hypothetical protein